MRLLFVHSVGSLSHALLVLSGHSRGGSDDKRDVFGRQQPFIWQRQCPPADFNPRYKRQYSDPSKAVVLPAAEPPGSGRVGSAPKLEPQHCPSSADQVKLWNNYCIYKSLYYSPQQGFAPTLAKKYLNVTMFRSVQNIL